MRVAGCAVMTCHSPGNVSPCNLVPSCLPVIDKVGYATLLAAAARAPTDICDPDRDCLRRDCLNSVMQECGQAAERPFQPCARCG
jgi:hypothetical protein